MTTIQLQIQDDLVQQLGLGAVKKKLDDELTYQRFKLLESRIVSAMNDATDVDWKDEFDKARQKAYEEHPQKRKSAL